MQFSYRFLKLNSLIPFHFDFDKGLAVPSRYSTLYALLFTSLLFLYLVHYLFNMLSLFVEIDGDLIMVLVLAVDLIATVLTSFSVYIIQIVQKDKIVVLVNFFIKLSQIIFDGEILTTSKMKFVFDCCKMKGMSVAAQLIFLSIAVGEFAYNMSLSDTMHNFILLIYINCTTTVAFSVFYSCSMLLSARFYQMLDQRMKKLNIFTDDIHPNSIDQISFLYQQITSFTTKLCAVYAVQIIVLLTSGIVWMVASVRKSPFQRNK